MATWTDEQKQELIDKYLEQDPTPANSMEIVKKIAEDMGHSPNAVRMILTQSGKYVKKDAAKPASGGSTTTTTASGDKAPRVSKEAAHAALSEAITSNGGEVDSEIVSKLTGKAAQYFTAVITAITSSTDD